MNRWNSCGYFIGIENVIDWDDFFVMEKYGENEMSMLN